LREGLSREYIGTLFAKLRELGMSDGEILQAVGQFAREHRKGENDERV
jgi:uncharacterized protein YoaH (UPF0181 family)